MHLVIMELDHEYQRNCLFFSIFLRLVVLIFGNLSDLLAVGNWCFDVFFGHGNHHVRRGRYVETGYCY